MSASMRIIDTGLKSARWNTAMTAALAELHRAGWMSDTIRFQRFERSVLVGRHQNLACEIDIDRCRKKRIETARRMTGGGAIYAEPGILSWEVVVDRDRFGGSCRQAAERICGGVAGGLARLGLPARRRGLDDIEVDGRKIGGASGYFDGPTLVYQGTIWADFNLADMAEALRLPFKSLDRDGLRHLARRVTSMSAIFGRHVPMQEVQDAIVASLSDNLRFSFVREQASHPEIALAERLHASEYGTDAFVLGADDVVPAKGTAAAWRKHRPKPIRTKARKVRLS